MRVLALVLIFFSGVAVAAPVTWSIDNLVFDDGGTASGGFSYDADSNLYADILIVTTPGSTLPGSVYSRLNPSPFGSSTATGLVVVDSDDPFDLSSAMGMSILFDAALSNIGGTRQITGFVEAMCSDPDCNAPADPRRSVLSGSVSAVPVPAAVWLLGSALAGLGWFRRN